MYDADIQDELEHDALAYGGQALVDDIHDEAGAYVDESHPWGGVGEEPAERVSAYLAVWWQRVELARSELLERTVRTAEGTFITASPACCMHGHPLDEGQVATGFQTCRCSGHHTWTCMKTRRGFLDEESQCRETVYYPPLAELCWEYIVSLSDCDC